MDSIDMPRIILRWN